jgi:GNAT superfamily N-acetyltransferase
VPTETVIVTTADRPDLDEQMQAALLDDWPLFVLNDRQAPEAMPLAWQLFPQFDIRLLEDDAIAAGGWGVPISWGGDPAKLPAGYDGALTAAIAGHKGGTVPDTLCVMAVAVRPDRQRGGLAGQVISTLRERAEQAGFARVVVPVRPTLKAAYPLTPMANFAKWDRGDGLHRDPWIRTHQRLGAWILGPAPESMVITGTIDQWEEWAGMAFPESGTYVVPGALEPITIDVEADLGTYLETNLWVQHK